MKKIIITMLALALLCNIAFPVQAISEQYELPELGLSLEVPSKYDVFTRSMDENDPLFSAYGFTKEDVIAKFVSADIYLDAITQDGSEEIVVTMTENSVRELNGFDDSVLMAFASTLKDEYVRYGVSVSSYDIYHHAQLAFVRVWFNITDETTYGLIYHTIYDNKTMNFTMRSYTGPISEAQENTIQSVVDSIYVDSFNYETSPREETAAFAYTDEETGLKFTVPANWKREELFEDRDFIDVKFVSTKDSRMVIMYGGTDLWAQIPESDKIGYKRSDIDNTMFTASHVTEMLGTSAPIESVMYNGKDYYLAEVTSQAEAYGLSLPVTTTHIIRIEDGWLYWFQFGGSKESEYFGDVEKLINSVSYPESNESANYPESDENSNVVSATNIPVLLGSLALTALADGAIPCIVARTRNKPITKKKYNIICYGLNVIVMILFVAINGASSGFPYFLWTWIFARCGLNTLTSRGVLEGAGSDSLGADPN